MTTQKMQTNTTNAIESSNHRVNATRLLISRSQAIRLKSEAQRGVSEEARVWSRSLIQESDAEIASDAEQPESKTA